MRTTNLLLLFVDMGETSERRWSRGLHLLISRAGSLSLRQRVGLSDWLRRAPLGP